MSPVSRNAPAVLPEFTDDDFLQTSTPKTSSTGF